MKNICILGATGSVGIQTLDVIRKQNEEFNLVAFSSNKSYESTIKIIEEFKPSYVAITDNVNYIKIKEYCKDNHININVLQGMEGLIQIVKIKEIHLVVTSIVGMIGLVPTIEAIKAGKDIALANKETLVTGGELVISEAKKYGVNILPVDSEHGAIFQCLQGNTEESLSKIILTASGGPFRGKTKEELINITPEEATNHPKWNMGKKISVDSSTLINKGLEVIEAHWLFGLDYDDINVIIHPESIIHSMVEYRDGSVIAQLAVPDMRLPIQYALSYPSRGNLIIDKLNFNNIKNLSFEEPDFKNFPGLKLAYDAGRAGGVTPTIFNAANEVAVDLFLNKKIQYLDIIYLIEDCLSKLENKSILSLDAILETEIKVKEFIKSKYN
ncbi:1-deoxy-D-xylulose-5-phosphate reductoisomerase [Clostridium sp. JNZ J1-5]